MNDQSEPVRFYRSLEQPLLILSSRVGRGNTSIAEAIHEYFRGELHVFHRSIEDFMPASIVREDLVHYKFISNNIPLLLALIYTVPLFYRRKLLREKIRTTRFPALKKYLIDNCIKTVICVSHRQAFWTTILKRNESLSITIYGVLTEFGNNLGWNHILWEKMDGFISPLNASAHAMGIPGQVPQKQLPLPARSCYYAMAKKHGLKNHCLLIGGFFGQGQMAKTVKMIHACFPGIHLYVICGDNDKLAGKLRKTYRHKPCFSIMGLVDSIDDYLLRCRCVITKPGMSTLLEAHAAQRKIFLFKGMPVAETNNARYAINNFDAEWFSVASFSRWLAAEQD